MGTSNFLRLNKTYIKFHPSISIGLVFFVIIFCILSIDMCWAQEATAEEPTAEATQDTPFPTAKNAQIDPTSLPAYQAVADYLINK